MADDGLTKFEIMQKKMAAKKKAREDARKGGGGGGGGKKKKKPKSGGGGGGGGGDPSEKGLSKFELMQKRMADKKKQRDDAKKGGGGGDSGSPVPKSSKSKGGGGGGTRGGSDSDDDDRRSASVHRKAMTTRINMNAVRDMDAKNDSESEEEDRNEPYNRIGSRRETAKKNAKMRKTREQIEVLSSSTRHTMDRPLENGDAVVFYSRSDGQYIPGIVDSIQKSGRESFYKLEKKYKSSFDPVYESKRMGKKVTMDDDPDRYRRTDKPALIKKDTYFAILTNNDFDIELRLALLRVFRDKLKDTLAKHKKKAAKKKRINAIVGTYGKDGGAQLGTNYDEEPIPKPKKEKPKMIKSKTTMKVTNVRSNEIPKKRKSKESKHLNISDNDSANDSGGNDSDNSSGRHGSNGSKSNRRSKKNSLNVASSVSNSSKKKHGGRAKSSANLPKIEKVSDKKSKDSRKASRNLEKSHTERSSRKSKSPKPSSTRVTSGHKSSKNKKESKKASSSSNKSSNKSSKNKSSKKDPFSHLLPNTEVSEWSMGDISKWLMYLSNTPFVPPDDDDSDADFFDEDELDTMAENKPKLFDKYFQYFVAAQIDGNALLALNKKTLAKTCKVKNSTDRSLLHLAIHDLKNGKVGRPSNTANSSSTGVNSSDDNSDKNDNNNNNNDDDNNNNSNNSNGSDDEKNDWKPLRKYNRHEKPAQMKKTKTVMSTVNTREDHRPMTARKEVALRVGGGHKSKSKAKSKSSHRGPQRPVSARKDDKHNRTPARRRFHDSDDDLDDSEDDNIDSESADDDDDEPLTYKMMGNKAKNNNKNVPVNDSMSLTRKLGGWDSDSD